VPLLQQHNPTSFDQYKAYTEHTCANRNQIYERRHFYQSILRQCLNNHILIPFFTLSRKTTLKPFLYKKLKQLVANEDSYIRDNKEKLE